MHVCAYSDSNLTLLQLLLSTVWVRYQNCLKSWGGCTTKMLRIKIIELLNGSNKSTHVLCMAESLSLSELNGIHIISLGVPEQLNPSRSQHVFTSPYIRVYRFAIQSLIWNSGHTCTLSGRTCHFSADVLKSRNRGLHVQEQWRTQS